MNLKEQIDETLEHSEEVTVSKTKGVKVHPDYTLKQLHTRLIGWYGLDRVSKTAGGFKVTR